MHKVLVVGCGGSGAKTLAYMMDQLKTTLAERLPDRYPSPKDVKLPRAWQFVTVDVPTAAEKAGPNLPNVSEAGGHYVSCGSTASYERVDYAVSQKLAAKKELGTIASWAHTDPKSETTPVSDGAGQFRAIGRMLALSKLADMQTELRKAWEVLRKAETIAELTELRHALYGHVDNDVAQEQPLVFVVSSMAGGAGASMAIDICRLLTSLDGMSPALTSLFMVTPDIFHKLDADSVMGTNPNALAMFAELVAAQSGAAAEADVRLFEDLGIRLTGNTAQPPIGRIFPVGVRSGTDGALLGDGHPTTVYRALGRGLAALMADRHAMQDFKAYTLTNRGGYPMDTSVYGWGIGEEKAIPWGSYGYAQLGMGRDRYAEYAAQRLAHSAVGRLLKGHVDVSNPASADAQLTEKLTNNYRGYAGALNALLPVEQHPGNWIMERFSGPIQAWVNVMADKVRTRIPKDPGAKSTDWVPAVDAALASVLAELDMDEDSLLYNGVYEWAEAEGVQEGLLDIIRAEVAKFGVPYGYRVVRAIREQLESGIITRTEQVAAYQPTLTLPSEVREALTSRKQSIANPNDYVERIVQGVTKELRFAAAKVIATTLAPVLKGFVQDFLNPLQETMLTGHRDLEASMQVRIDPNLGVSQLKTNVPNLWPDETQTTVPDRFRHAANEVFLTEVDSFPAQFSHDIIESSRSFDEQARVPDYVSSLGVAASSVISGTWQALSGAEQAPEDLLVLKGEWIPKDLVLRPERGSAAAAAPRTPVAARFEFNIQAGKVLDRARQYIRRPGYSFNTFISTSLREYILTPGLTESERNGRRTQVLTKFREAMSYALPLAQVNADLVRALYGREVEYRFTFSSIPFGGDELAQALEKTVLDFPNHTPADRTRPLGTAMTNQGEERAIDIFGSYPNYAPIVFESLLPPIAEQWQKMTMQRGSFWALRRTRPLPAALPMSNDERFALIAGWYIGRMIGQIVYPDTLDVADDAAVQVWDPLDNQWVNFDAPMLTPVSHLRHQLDWLPSLLESASMGWARAGQHPVMHSVKPYVLMRHLYDTAASPSRDGRTLNGQALLRAWIHTGVREAGETGQVPGTGMDATPEQRRDAALAWLGRHYQMAQSFLPTGIATAGQVATPSARAYGDITDRRIAAKTPVIHDLAADIVDVTEKLAALVKAAYIAGPPGSSPDVPARDPFGDDDFEADLMEDFGDL
ncbi:hypothetical protein C1Y63_10705 [Corynebacterium sp. 13CS0277]|uniref:tubulin-like doman-containing protein n=1 Tax=Corynebacterium sp. 13CS0277 TaxID=2071994 RepID=UPI000D02FE12|nr:tubulin-like doman-containing protein [Corynebacterium sp. 13CS0277]PRQ10575.1 hypothetical protein C1Y63_10705 [Corynebacterium sp. 13CS0277]